MQQQSRVLQDLHAVIEVIGANVFWLDSGTGIIAHDALIGASCICSSVRS